MFSGSLGIGTTVAVALFALDKIPQVSSLRAQYPIAVVGLAAFDLLVVYSTFRQILFFALAVLIPIALSIIHASVRSRGIKNKVSNKIEQISGQIYTNSPMGLVLSVLGLEAKDCDE